MSSNFGANTIRNLLNDVNILAIMTHGDFQVQVGEEELCLWVACHCCLNGPVGIRKTTTFLFGEKVQEMAIQDVCVGKGSNKGWKKLCSQQLLRAEFRLAETACLSD